MVNLANDYTHHESFKTGRNYLLLSLSNDNLIDEKLFVIF